MPGGDNGRATLFLEDLTPGRTFGSGTIEIRPDAIRQFEAEYGPPAPQGDFVNVWLIASLTMRLLVEGEMQPQGGIVGSGIEQLRWPAPARPGDVLSLRTEILEARRSRSRPEQGVVKVRTETLNQHGIVVQIIVPTMIVPARDRPPLPTQAR